MKTIKIKSVESFENSDVTVSLHGEFFEPTWTSAIEDRYALTRIDDAIHVRLEKGEVWIFDYGVSVGWGAAKNELERLFGLLSAHLRNPASAIENEIFTFAISVDAPFSCHHDHFSLPNDHPFTRLAISHSLAQSQKLSNFESDALEVIESNRNLSRQLAAKGKLSLSLRELSKIRGQLFEKRNDIFLNFGLLDVPEFFWEYPELEELYTVSARYLDIKQRTEILSRKLEIIHELVEMLANEQHQKHSAFLEWIIIILIAFDIAVNLPNHLPL